VILSFDIRRAAQRACAFIRTFRLVECVFIENPSTPYRWHSLGYRNRDGSQRQRPWVCQIIDIVILLMRRGPHASRSRWSGILESRILQIFDRTGSKQLVGTAIHASGLTKKTIRRRFSTTCLHARAESSLSLSRLFIDSF
jgi:hypothetical protein